MSVEPVLSPLGVQAVHPRQDAGGKSPRDPGRDGKSGQTEKGAQDAQESPGAFVNALGELTGKTINITA